MLSRALYSTSKWSFAGAVALLFLAPACQYDGPLSQVGCQFDTDCPGSNNICVDGYCVEEVVPGDPLDRITVTPAATSLLVGQTVTFTAVLLDAEGTALTDRTATWSSSNAEVARIDEDGTVTALTPGTVLIRATSGRVAASAALSVLAEPDPVDPGDLLARIVITPAVASLTIGSTAQLSAELFDADDESIEDRQPLWASSDPEIATVTQDGLVTALTPGTVIIRASSGLITAAAAVTVTPEEIFVAQVTVDPASETIRVGEAIQLTGLALDGSGAILGDRVIAWSSSDSSIALVGSTGMVTGLTAGTVTVVASSEGQQAQATITVEDRGPDSIQLIPQAATLAIDETIEVTAIVRDDRGVELGEAVSWSSSNAAVASVNAQGLITAIGTGTATITATSGDASVDFVVTVVSRSVTSVVVSPLSVTLEVGATQSLSAVARAGQTNLSGLAVDSWTSADAGVATVAANGHISAVAPGVTVITATIDGIEGKAFVQVVPRTITAVTVSPSAATIREGGFVDLSATALADEEAQAGRIVQWSSNNPAVATVDGNGRVYGLAEGPVTIRATIEGASATATITVSPRAVDSVTVSPLAASLEVGDALSLTAVVRADDGRDLPAEGVTWSSASSAVSVSAAGLVTALMPGVAEVVARSTTNNAISATSTITVSPKSVTGITVSPSTLTRAVGAAAVQLTAEVRAGSDVVTDRTVTWTSSNDAAAAVSATGLVTFLAPGTALITATSEGRSASTAVTVTPMPVTQVTIAAVETELEIGQSTTLTATLRNGDTVLNDRLVQWFSSDNSVAVVNSAGTVVAIGEGTATITAVSEGVISNGIAFTVNGPEPVLAVTDVVIASLVSELEVGQSTMFSVTVLSGTEELNDRLVQWVSSDTAVAVVDASGRVYARGQGTATITAVSEGVTSNGIEVTVTGPEPGLSVTNVIIASMVSELEVGQSATFTVTVLSGTEELEDRLVQWLSSDTAVAVVDASGTVYARGAGTATITAVSEGVTSNGIVVTVTGPEPVLPVTDVIIASLVSELEVGQTTTFSVTVLSGTEELEDRLVRWFSSNSAAAVVDASGTVYARGAGTATITAVSEGVTSNGIDIAVIEPVDPGPAPDSIEIIIEEGDFGGTALLPVIEPGMVLTLSAIVRDEDDNVLENHPVIWSATPGLAVSVDPATGEVVGIEPGTEIVTATSGVDGNVVGVLVVTVTFEFEHLAVGGNTACAVSTLDNLYCWGLNGQGQFGDGSTLGSTLPRLVASNVAFTSLVIGASHGCGLDEGDAYCWGLNDRGQLGDGSSDNSLVPVLVEGSASFAKLAVGFAHTCGLTTDGDVYCWGANDSGQLGDGTNEDRVLPTKISGTRAYIDLGVGDVHSCALATTGRVFCWGSNADRRLGQPTTGGAQVASSNVPMEITNGPNMMSLEIGARHGCAIEDAVNGQTYCWGHNSDGQLGDGSTASKNNPTAISTAARFATLASGGSHQCGLTSTGDAYCWGRNADGQVGIGSTVTPQTSPVAVTGGRSFVSLSAGSVSTCGIATDGLVYCWGRGNEGQIGDDDSTTRTAPTPIAWP
jgi:trimeric autotransporter adhesin